MKNSNNNFLGELESAIMEIVWRLEETSVRDVLNKLNVHRDTAYTTVMTVMGRLHDKGILERNLDDSGAYLYKPKKSKNEFLKSTSKKVISSLIKEYGDVAVAQFIDVIESSNSKDADKWRSQLKKIR